MQYLTYMGEHTKVIRFKQKSLLGISKHSEHDSESKTASNMADPIKVKVCWFSLLDGVQS
jgi:hypothetical protein